MRAIRVNEFGGPEVLKLEDVPDPSPGPSQVVVRVRAVGVNPVDTYIRSGAYGKDRSLPYTPGTDAAGEVEAVGAEVKGLRKGDRVYTLGSVSGAYAEMSLCQAEQVHPLPPSAGYEEGAALGVPYSTAYRALHGRAQSCAGETVLVHGASGGVGIAAVQLARAFGLIVIGTAGSEAGLKLVREQGAHHALDHRTDDHMREVMELTGGRGVDVALEMAAHRNLNDDLDALAPGGRVVVIGSRGPIEIDPRKTMGRNADIRGMMLWGTPPDELAGIQQAIYAGLENGTLRPIIDVRIPLAEASRAHTDVMAAAHSGKIVLIP